MFMKKNTTKRIIKTEKIREYIKSNNITLEIFADKCHISLSTLLKVLRGDDVLLGTLLKIANGMECNIAELVL